MNIENARQSGRHGKSWEQIEREQYAGPLTLREFARDANWPVIVTLLALAGFWCWVGYNIAQWWPA